MTHYTVNTGHSNQSPRSGISQAAIEVLKPIMERGGPIPNCSPFRTTITRRRLYGVHHLASQRADSNLLDGMTTEGEAEAWPAIEKLYLDLSDKRPELVAPGKVAEKPGSLPWLAVVLLPFIVNQRREDMGWLGDFERCMAWTILANASGQT